MAFSIIRSKANFLFFSDNFFESLIKSDSKSGGNITPAATTGPDKHPRPNPPHPNQQ